MKTPSQSKGITGTQLRIVVQLFGCVQFFVTPWTAAHQASLSFTVSRTLLKLMSIELVMPSNHVNYLHAVIQYPAITSTWYHSVFSIFTFSKAINKSLSLPLFPCLFCHKQPSTDLYIIREGQDNGS